MTQDLIELLDRQFQFLLSQDGSTFLRELRRTFEVLHREQRLAALLDDERRSALTPTKQDQRPNLEPIEARQVHETMGRLRGSRYQVHEAFYVVFRLGGRPISLPDRIPCGEWTLYPVLIDLAPASESGRRARESLIITEEELRPHAASSRI